MATEIDLGGTIYISSKHAAGKTGYTQDYIGQLARSGQIEARRVAGMWYILEQSLRDYKTKADQFVPVPPGFTPNTTAETAVSFDGKDYISTSRAAKITGYNQDYVGQLARSGEVLSRQVGTRWYLDRESLLAHKKQKDDLLAAVQVESVGLAKPEEMAPIPDKPAEVAVVEEEVTHFEYVREEAPLIPEPAPDLAPLEVDEPEPMPEFPRRKVAKPVFEEYRAEALHIPPAPEPVEEPAAAPEPVPEPEAVITEDKIEEIASREEEKSIPIRVREPEMMRREPQRAPIPEAEIIEEHIYVDSLDEALSGASAPQSKVTGKKPGKGAIFAMSGIAVAAAVGTLAYIGTSLGFINLDGVIPPSQTTQNAAATNSVVQNGSSIVPETLRNLFSKEIVYTRK